MSKIRRGGKVLEYVGYWNIEVNLEILTIETSLRIYGCENGRLIPDGRLCDSFPFPTFVC